MSPTSCSWGHNSAGDVGSAACPHWSPGSPSLLPVLQLLLSPSKGCAPRALLSGAGMDISLRKIPPPALPCSQALGRSCRCPQVPQCHGDVQNSPQLCGTPSCPAVLGDHPQQHSGRSPAGKELAGQVRRHTSIFPWLSHPMPPVNMSLSDEKVNKFSSRLKVSIISFVSDK